MGIRFLPLYNHFLSIIDFFLAAHTAKLPQEFSPMLSTIITSLVNAKTQKENRTVIIASFVESIKLPSVFSIVFQANMFFPPFFFYLLVVVSFDVQKSDYVLYISLF